MIPPNVYPHLTLNGFDQPTAYGLHTQVATLLDRLPTWGRGIEITDHGPDERFIRRYVVDVVGWTSFGGYDTLDELTRWLASYLSPIGSGGSSPRGD